MEQKDNKQGQSFLDKFKGRANRIDKTGLTNVLDPIKLPTPQKQIQPTPRRRLPSLQRKQNQDISLLDKVDHSQLASSRSEGINKGRAHQLKALGNAKLNSNRMDILPPIYSPGTPNRKELSLQPPSRSISDRSENLERKIFGKYLKLDEQAMKHLQYLHRMDTDRAKRKPSLTERSQL